MDGFNSLAGQKRREGPGELLEVTLVPLEGPLRGIVLHPPEETSMRPTRGSCRPPSADIASVRDSVECLVPVTAEVDLPAIDLDVPGPRACLKKGLG